ncbi:GFA family protein [Fodinicurvata fenggangensis]|uniref:GFA family protein n=1 Tax=Fodinicurvata fenggangensis TaxID=1121830 RepID=UPI00047C0651|nr:GFA family protein [Fodinicurvata fenggangensis]
MDHRNFKQNPLTGGCQCGKVRYRISAGLERPHICHCRMCQKASGTPFMAFAEVASSDFAWTREEPSWFRSSEAVERGFCSACGTPLHFRYVGSDKLDITLASLDEPNLVQPEEEVGCEGRLSWIDLIGQLPRSTTEATTPPEVLKTYASRQHPDHE